MDDMTAKEEFIFLFKVYLKQAKADVKKWTEHLERLEGKEDGIEKAMSLDRAMTILKDRADSNECDGECDTEKPYVKCKECEARSVLNEVNDIVRAAVRT